MNKITIRFIEDYAPKDGTGRTYTVGQEIEVREDSARHFISRRKAVAVNGEITPPQPLPDPGASLTDKAEEQHEKKRGRKPKEHGENETFAAGEEA